MMRYFLYGLAAILSFLVFVVAFAPATVAWQIAGDDIRRAVPDLSILTLDGSVWNGDATLRYREFPPTDLGWEIAPGAAVTGALDLAAVLEGPGLSATGTAEATRSGADIDASGYVDASYINPVSVRYGLSFPGRVEIRSLTARSDRSWLTAAAGDLYWDGGRVVVETPGGAQVLDLPPLTGTLSMRGADLALDVTHDDQLLIQVFLKRNGWAEVDIKARLLEVSGLPYRAGTSPNASAIIVEEKLF